MDFLKKFNAFSAGTKAFLAFTGTFAVLVAYLFWGTWSPDVAPVMPDNAITHSVNYLDTLEAVFRKFLASGKFIPSDVLWEGLFVSPYACQELKYASALYCAGLGLAYFLRGRGLSHLAAYGAGLLLAFCGYWASLFSAGHAGWFCWMTYGVFAFGLVDRAVMGNRARHWLLLGACVAWGSFYQPDLWLFFTLLTGAYFIWRCVNARALPWKGMLLAAAALFAIGGASFHSALTHDLAARKKQIQEGETLSAKTAAASDDAEKRWIFTTNWSLPPNEVAEFFVPRVNGDTSCPLVLSIGTRLNTGVKPYTGALGRPKDAPRGNYRQHSLYVGLVTGLLALAALVLDFRRRDTWFFAAVAVTCLLLSFGRHFEPLYRLVFALPLGDLLRGPVKWHHLTEFALVVLAGFGIDALRRLPFLHGARGALLVGALVLVGAADLARVDRLYCAPVDLHRVRQINGGMHFSVLNRADFGNAQVKEAVRRGSLVPLANYLGNPSLYLVEVLDPHTATKEPLPPFTTSTALGLVSLLATLGLAVFVLRRAPAAQ